MADENNIEITEKILETLKLIIKNVYDKREAVEFRIPVDYEALGLLDYPVLIKEPMDLGTIKKKLNSKQYKYVKDFVLDIQKVWDNCKLYNVDFSKIYKLADKMEQYSIKLINESFPNNNFYEKNIKKDINIDNINDKIYEKISTKELHNLSQRISLLNERQLEEVVNIIFSKSPEGVLKYNEEDYQLLLHKISYNCYIDLDKFISSVVN